jgi:hypothetical protein
MDIGTTFPDCIAKQIKDRKEVRIEFEYHSSDFVGHKHPTDGCDIIVCWEDDIKLAKPKVVALKEFFPSLREKPNKPDDKIKNVHQIIMQRAAEPEGLAYPDLMKLLSQFDERNVNEPTRCLARLFMWGCFPFADKGRLKIRRKPIVDIEKYAVQTNKLLMSLGKDILKLLEEQGEATAMSPNSGHTATLRPNCPLRGRLRMSANVRRNGGLEDYI